ncbi:MAG: nucleotidyltransferase family protein [Clostridiales bacterium]|nr:nucleotidyltransferase family protein [Clostridiales bacterium]
MRVIGIIAEYNPFHGGHSCLIEEAKRLVGDPRSVVLTVMSGPFTQRGLPAISPKHVRAKEALVSGVDVAIELPFTLACAPSERFAYGAVELLYRTGVVTDIAFGVDCKEPELLYELAKLEPAADTLKNALSDGKSFPAARAEALIAAYKGNADRGLISDTLRQPNSILALDYIRACRDLNTGFKIHMIPRCEGYSATSIREELRKADTTSVASIANTLMDKMPDKALSVMLSALSNKEFTIPSMDNYMTDAFLEVRRTRDMSSTAYMTDGLDGFIRNHIDDDLQTKHFTMPRIYRALASLMVGQEASYIENEKHVQYIRILGFSTEGKYCLKIMGKCARLPIISNASDALELYSTNPRLKQQFELDLLSNDIYARYSSMEQSYEWKLPPVRVK